MDKKNNHHLGEPYEYELPGEPLNPSDEPLGKSFFTHPSVVPDGVKPYDPHGPVLGFQQLKYWFLACAVMIIFGLVFEFGLLGKEGKEGPLCQYLPKNKVCYYLAGPPPSPSKP
ncbi:hypothetical protein [Commensalibacter oyaizuii]|uniref:Uncharacterized protein n=1 Tax=Commensalibacter oyaizuii TaxID=3043873 RepID=A0ABT6Q5K3_9PROT|nr:hypothetical protein [Commensalibacter sp. TBRC 16381]MDI2091841.1 hypothetical protein [Commensalibacter sp. TBRC 16381]